jgi:nucleotide-binding universal stress UspA family protein
VLLQLEDVAHELREEGIEVETQVRWSDPVSAIVGAACDYGASVIVRSSYERHDFSGWLRRTIIDEVMDQIHIPVLIVPAGGSSAPTPDSRLRVLVPLDGSALAESALVHLREVAACRPLEVCLVNVVQQRLGPFGALLPILSDPGSERRETMRYLHEVAAKLRADGVVAHAQVIESRDSVARELLDIAKRSGADVIAIATRGRNDPSHPALGSVSTTIVEHSPIPVLLAPSIPESAPINGPPEIESRGVAEDLQRLVRTPLRERAHGLAVRLKVQLPATRRYLARELASTATLLANLRR